MEIDSSNLFQEIQAFMKKLYFPQPVKIQQSTGIDPNFDKLVKKKANLKSKIYNLQYKLDRAGQAYLNELKKKYPFNKSIIILFAWKTYDQQPFQDPKQKSRQYYLEKNLKNKEYEIFELQYESTLIQYANKYSSNNKSRDFSDNDLFELKQYHKRLLKEKNNKLNQQIDSKFKQLKEFQLIKNPRKNLQTQSLEKKSIRQQQKLVKQSKLISRESHGISQKNLNQLASRQLEKSKKNQEESSNIADAEAKNLMNLSKRSKISQKNEQRFKTSEKVDKKINSQNLKQIKNTLSQLKYEFVSYHDQFICLLKSNEVKYKQLLIQRMIQNYSYFNQTEQKREFYTRIKKLNNIFQIKFLAQIKQFQDTFTDLFASMIQATAKRAQVSQKYALQVFQSYLYKHRHQFFYEDESGKLLPFIQFYIKNQIFERKQEKLQVNKDSKVWIQSVSNLIQICRNQRQYLSQLFQELNRSKNLTNELAYIQKQFDEQSINKFIKNIIKQFQGNYQPNQIIKTLKNFLKIIEKKKINEKLTIQLFTKLDQIFDENYQPQAILVQVIQISFLLIHLKQISKKFQSKNKALIEKENIKIFETILILKSPVFSFVKNICAKIQNIKNSQETLPISLIKQGFWKQWYDIWSFGREYSSKLELQQGCQIVLAILKSNYTQFWNQFNSEYNNIRLFIISVSDYIHNQYHSRKPLKRLKNYLVEIGYILMGNQTKNYVHSFLNNQKFLYHTIIEDLSFFQFVHSEIAQLVISRKDQYTVPFSMIHFILRILYLQPKLLNRLETLLINTNVYQGRWLCLTLLHFLNVFDTSEILIEKCLMTINNILKCDQIKHKMIKAIIQYQNFSEDIHIKVHQCFKFFNHLSENNKIIQQLNNNLFILLHLNQDNPLSIFNNHIDANIRSASKQYVNYTNIVSLEQSLQNIVMDKQYSSSWLMDIMKFLELVPQYLINSKYIQKLLIYISQRSGKTKNSIIEHFISERINSVFYKIIDNVLINSEIFQTNFYEVDQYYDQKCQKVNDIIASFKIINFTLYLIQKQQCLNLNLVDHIRSYQLLQNYKKEVNHTNLDSRNDNKLIDVLIKLIGISQNDNYWVQKISKIQINVLSIQLLTKLIKIQNKKKQLNKLITTILTEQNLLWQQKIYDVIIEKAGNPNFISIIFDFLIAALSHQNNFMLRFFTKYSKELIDIVVELFNDYTTQYQIIDKAIVFISKIIYYQRIYKNFLTDLLDKQILNYLIAFCKNCPFVRIQKQAENQYNQIHYNFQEISANIHFVRILERTYWIISKLILEQRANMRLTNTKLLFINFIELYSPKILNLIFVKEFIYNNQLSQSKGYLRQLKPQVTTVIDNMDYMYKQEQQVFQNQFQINRLTNQLYNLKTIFYHRWYELYLLIINKDQEGLIINQIAEMKQKDQMFLSQFFLRLNETILNFLQSIKLQKQNNYYQPLYFMIGCTLEFFEFHKFDITNTVEYLVEDLKWIPNELITTIGQFMLCQILSRQKSLPNQFFSIYEKSYYSQSRVNNEILFLLKNSTKNFKEQALDQFKIAFSETNFHRIAISLNYIIQKIDQYNTSDILRSIYKIFDVSSQCEQIYQRGVRNNNHLKWQWMLIFAREVVSSLPYSQQIGAFYQSAANRLKYILNNYKNDSRRTFIRSIGIRQQLNLIFLFFGSILQEMVSDNRVQQMLVLMIQSSTMLINLIDNKNIQPYCCYQNTLGNNLLGFNITLITNLLNSYAIVLNELLYKTEKYIKKQQDYQKYFKNDIPLLLSNLQKLNESNSNILQNLLVEYKKQIKKIQCTLEMGYLNTMMQQHTVKSINKTNNFTKLLLQDSIARHAINVIHRLELSRYTNNNSVEEYISYLEKVKTNKNSQYQLKSKLNSKLQTISQKIN